MRRWALGLLATLLVAACGSAPMPSASPSAAATAATSTPIVAATPSSQPPTSTSTPLATLALDESIKLDPTRVLQVCHGTFERQSLPMMECGNVIKIALQALGGDAAHVARADFRFACTAGPCLGASSDLGNVVVSGATLASEVTVVRGSDGGLAPTAIRAVEMPAAHPFTPPAVARPAVAGATKAIAGRTPYPLCGDETAPMHGPFDQAARTCFLTGVLAGARVEFVARSRGLEGEPTVLIYRFDGSGGLLIYSLDKTDSVDTGRWLSFWSGISDGAGDRVFDLGGDQTMAVAVN